MDDLTVAEHDGPGDLGDYELVRDAIAYISEEYRRQPSLEAVAQALGQEPSSLASRFSRWSGLTPKAFLQAVTLDRARRLLDDGASLLDAAFDVGMSGPSRLHDLFVKYEALSPGGYKTKGQGLQLAYGYHNTPFGHAIVAASDRGLAGIGFAEPGESGRIAMLDDFVRRWPNASFVRDQDATIGYTRRVFDPREWRVDKPLRIVLIGTDFEIRVWEALLKVPFGGATNYAAIARTIGAPKAARAVGGAVGRNPVSFVVPCHRVIGKSGDLTGYHWGVARKRTILGWEKVVLQHSAVDAA